MNDSITLVVVIAVSAIFGGMVGFSMGRDAQLKDMREAYKTCLVAHFEVNGDSEQACGNAQDITSTEFLCNQQNHCWLEVK